MFFNVFILAVGLVVLGVGGEVLVRGASRLARNFGISSLVVGLTVVAFGTSAPEVAVSAVAGLRDQDAIAISNVLGSNISNLLLVLGLAALARPLAVSRSVIRTDLPVMLLVSAAFALLAHDGGEITRTNGVILILALAGYVALTYHSARQQPPAVEEEFDQALRTKGSVAFNLVQVLVGLAGLVFGAELIVDGAVGLAELFHVPSRIIGLTIVAVGTSLPELTVCVIAARRGQPDIAVGNVVGSNIFNILAVIGIAGIIAPLSVEYAALYRDVPIMLAVSVLIFPIMRTGHVISRWEGTVLVALYGAYAAATVTLR